MKTANKRPTIVTVGALIPIPIEIACCPVCGKSLRALPLSYTPVPESQSLFKPDALFELYCETTRWEGCNSYDDEDHDDEDPFYYPYDEVAEWFQFQNDYVVEIEVSR